MTDSSLPPMPVRPKMRKRTGDVRGLAAVRESRSGGMPVRKQIPKGPPEGPVSSILREQKLRTVCEDARCPNRHECYSSGTATFIILGDVCTRNCPYCAIPQGKPKAPDLDEPRRLAVAAKGMGLQHVVITSVNRDDLPDGGATHFARCIEECRAAIDGVTLEVLTPDFLGLAHCGEIVFAARPEVFNHNIETVPRLFRVARPGGEYQRSLDLLQAAASEMARQKAEREADASIAYTMQDVKSGLMVGLGETREEISQVLRDLRAHGVTILTVGQYLKSDPAGLDVQKYYSIPEYSEIKAEADALGFREAFCGPFVRSSYHARELFTHHAS
ncbi:MAG: lipoyl synthase [Planctomycetota bacterium]